MLTPPARSMFAWEGNSSAPLAKIVLPRLMAVSGDGKMPGLHSCLAIGRRETVPTPTPASLRSPFFLGAKASGRLDVYTQGKQGSDCRGNAQKSELGKLAAFPGTLSS